MLFDGQSLEAQLQIDMFATPADSFSIVGKFVWLREIIRNSEKDLHVAAWTLKTIRIP
jgi:hypothetical protein